MALTEPEYMASQDPLPMMNALPWWANTLRRRRLFVCACCRRIWQRLPDSSKQAVELGEQYADGRIRECELLAGDPERKATSREWVPFAEHAAAFAAARGTFVRQYRYAGASHYAACAVSGGFDPSDSSRHQVYLAERAAQARLIREIFNNPFRRVLAEPAWVTPDVAALAKAAYDERALPVGELSPARLGVLADALEEVGGSPEMFTHLRAPEPHVRGCWAVDTILQRAGLLK